jgi:hypothetical protein
MLPAKCAQLQQQNSGGIPKSWAMKVHHLPAAADAEENCFEL